MKIHNNSVISLEYNKHNLFHRIRSFVRRQGRITNSQKYALNNFWQVIGIEYQRQLLDFNDFFVYSLPMTLEIGFGTGTSLVSTAVKHPERNFLGIEVYLPGVGSCLASAKKAGTNNLRIICHDAVEVLENMIPDGSLELIQLFFPDPWHKTRHKKRRIIQKTFIELIGYKLVNSGIFHIATDWKPYAEHILASISDNKLFYNLSTTNDYIPRPFDRPYTKFEQRGKLLGHNIWDLMFIKKN